VAAGIGRPLKQSVSSEPQYLSQFPRPPCMTRTLSMLEWPRGDTFHLTVRCRRKRHGGSPLFPRDSLVASLKTWCTALLLGSPSGPSSAISSATLVVVQFPLPRPLVGVPGGDLFPCGFVSVAFQLYTFSNGRSLRCTPDVNTDAGRPGNIFTALPEVGIAKVSVKEFAVFTCSRCFRKLWGLIGRILPI
jgi:hypothetical protein